jgi:hypothetical protein
VPDQTLRYRAVSRISYAQALLALVQCARHHPGPDFEFGPLDLSALESSGLTVSGPDLSAVTDCLDRTPGLVEVPA